MRASACAKQQEVVFNSEQRVMCNCVPLKEAFNVKENKDPSKCVLIQDKCVSLAQAVELAIQLWPKQQEAPNQPSDEVDKRIDTADAFEGSRVKLLRAVFAEAIGTAMIVFFGCGSVLSSFTGAYQGIWQVAVVWGLGVALAIFATAEASGAHLNPAVTLAFWLIRPQAHAMTNLKAALYISAQFIGAFFAGLLNLLLHSSTIIAFERNNQIVRGEPESIKSALAFGEYFPNPSLSTEWGSGPYTQADITPLYACAIEAWGTFILAFVIFGITHERNTALGRIGRPAVPVVIGATVSVLLALYAPLTQAGWNPARDFGPRLVAAMAGWGTVALPGPNGGFWVYLVGPCLGAPLGAALAEKVLWRSTGASHLEATSADPENGRGCVSFESAMIAHGNSDASKCVESNGKCMSVAEAMELTLQLLEGNHDSSIPVEGSSPSLSQEKLGSDRSLLLRALLAEAIGTAMIVIFGCGSVLSSLTGAYQGIWQVAVVWGVGVALAILATAEASGAHLNPAITLAFWFVRPQAHSLTKMKVALYVTAQFVGAFLAGAVNLFLYSSTISAFERTNQIVRGEPSSIKSALAFGEYFPNPSLSVEWGAGPYTQDDISPMYACAVEAWGTFILAFVIFGITNERNSAVGRLGKPAIPFLIGLTVSVLLAVYAPLTQAGWNPARDLGPRLVAAMAGWGKVAFPGTRGGFWVYIVGPCLGAPLGALLSDKILWRYQLASTTPNENKVESV